MKKILLFFLCLLLCSSCIFADDELSDDSSTVQDNSSTGTPVVVDITQLINNIKNDDDASKSDNDPQLVEVLEPQLVEVNVQKTTITPQEANGFKAVLLSVIGDYETTVTDYVYQSSGSYQSHSISIERDWSWICSCCLFGLLCWCTFRTIGGICARW